MKTALLFILLALFTGMQTGTRGKSGSKGPKISFENTEYSFGVIEAGDISRAEFHFKNNGNSPLILTNVKVSCGCMCPEWPKDPIGPGKTGTVRIAYDSRSRVGPFQKTTTVCTNAGEEYIVLTICGVVIPQGGSASDYPKSIPGCSCRAKKTDEPFTAIDESIKKTKEIPVKTDQAISLTDAGEKIPVVMEETSIILYPNPSLGQFTVESSKEDFSQVEVFTLTGELIGTYPCEAGVSSVNVTLPDAANGMYLVKVRAGEKNWVKILVVGK